MARSRAAGRFEAALGLVGILALATSYVLVTGSNPLPAVGEWVSHAGSLARPEATWKQDVGAPPSAAVIAGRSIVVTMRGGVEVRGRDTGRLLWQRQADWAAVAGDGDGSIVLLGRRGLGMEAVDPASGSGRWGDRAAVGAWAYRDAVLVLACPAPPDCVVTWRAPQDGAVRWKVTLPGLGHVGAGDTSPMRGLRPVSTAHPALSAMALPPVPAMLAFPAERRTHLVDTVAGQRVRQEESTGARRVLAAGGRFLVSTTVPRDGTCRSTVEAREPGTGRPIWKKEGYDLGTVSGSGCDQRRDPAGAGGVIVATRGDNRPVLLAARDGREVWVGGTEEAVLDTDGARALIGRSDRTSFAAVDLGTGARLWERPMGQRAAVTLTRSAVLVSDPVEHSLAVYEASTGRPLTTVRTQADVLGCGGEGLVLGRGRTIGYLPATG